MRPVFNHRIAFLRPLRPPSVPPTSLPWHNVHRIFSTRSALNFVGRTHQRPSTPYLSPARTHSGPLMIRPLSTEQKDYIRYQLKLGAYWTALIWVTIGGFSVAYFVLRQDWLDRQHPAPREWGMWARKGYREAEHELEEEQYGSSMVDWSQVALGYLKAVELCETGGIWKIEQWQKNALRQNEDWDKPEYDFPGFTDEVKDDMRQNPVSPMFEVKKVGFDITGQTERYRHAYFTSLMGVAKASEMLDGKVRDTSRRLIFPRNQMIGPSNPRPRPIYPGSPPAPLEENCEPAYDDPEVYYRRLLTTKGLTTAQRMEAGLAYAAWVDYAGDTPRANALYKWTLSLACLSFTSAHPSTPLSTVLNQKTGALLPSAPFTTPNLHKATTALASHHARSGNIPAALGIYLSVLRARRAAPDAPPSRKYSPKRADMSLRSVDSVLRWALSVPFDVDMPPLPETGDEAYERTRGDGCDEAALMVYVGEILFASEGGAERRLEGLGWTRDAVALAEAGHRDERLQGGKKRVCTQCLGTGYENWEKMLGVLVWEEEARYPVGRRRKSVLAVKGGGGGLWDELGPAEEVDGDKTGGSWWSWVPFTGRGGFEKSAGDREQWRTELKAVQRKHVAFAEERMMAMLNREIATKSDWFVI